MIEYFDILRVITAFIVLLLASYEDIKDRRIRSLFSLILLSVGSIIFFIESLYLGEKETLILFTGILSNLIISMPFLLILYKIGIFGLGDIKILAGLSILIPKQPSLLIFPVSNTLELAFPYNMANSFILNLLLYTSILGFVLTPLYIIILNLRENNLSIHEFPQILYKVKTEEVSKYHGTFKNYDTKFFKDFFEWLDKNDEDINKESVKEFVDLNNEWETDNIEKDLNNIKKIVNKDEYMINYYIPFILPLFIGFIVTIILGNPIMLIETFIY